LGEIFPFFGKEILARTALVLGAHDSQPWKCITVPNKYCPDIPWEGNIETGYLGTLIEYPCSGGIHLKIDSLQSVHQKCMTYSNEYIVWNVK